MKPNRRGATNSKTDVASVDHLISLVADTVEGDLAVLLLGFREEDAQLVLPFGWNIVATANTSTDPASYVAWKRVGTEGNAAVAITTVLSTLMTCVVATFDGDTVDWTDPILATARHEGSTSSPNPLNPSPFPADWTDPQGGTAEYHGGAAIMFRGNGGTPDVSGTGYDVDASSNLAGPNDFNGIRMGRGFSHATGGGAGGNGTGYTTTAATLASNARSTALAFAVQGLDIPVPPAVGDPFDYAQDTGTFRVAFTENMLEGPTSWLWDFGDGSTSTLQNPIHTYAAGDGDYTVTLVASNAAGDSVMQSRLITVLPIPPQASWLYAEEGGTFRVKFIDQSIDADSYLWEIDLDGTIVTYTTPDAIHTFTQAGTYRCRLTATNTAGSDALERNVDVTLGVTPPERKDGIAISVGIAYEGSWHDITCDIIDMDWLFGSDDDLGVLTVPQAAKFILRISDKARVFDPENTASPIYGKWNVGSLLRIQMGKDAAVVTYWTGFIADLNHDLLVATILGDDLVARLANYDVDLEGDQSLPAQDAGARLETLLTVANWPSSSRDIEPGGSSLQATVVSDQSVWKSMTDVQKADLGRLMVTQDGRLVYRGRGTSWVGGDPVLTFGCTTPEGTAPDAALTELSLAGATRALVNMARVSRLGGEDQTYIRQESIDAYGRFTAVNKDLLLSSDTELESWATHILDRHDQPSYQGRRIGFYLSPDTVLAVGSLEMGALIRVYDDTHGTPIDITARLIGMRFVVTPHTVRVTMTTTKDHPLSDTELSASIETDTDWAASVRADNVKTVDTGDPAVLSLDVT